MSISIDVFDMAAAEKKFKEIEEKCNKDVSFSKSKIAEKMGVNEKDLNIPGGNFAPISEVINNIGDPVFRAKVSHAIKDLRAEQISGGGSYDSLTPDQKTQVDIESGSTDQERFVNKEKADWMYNAAHQKTRKGGNAAAVNETRFVNLVSSDGSERPKLAYGDATTKPSAEERDEVTSAMQTQGKSGIYVNEKTKEDPNSLNIVFNGKQSAMRMSKEGFHLSTDQSYNILVGGSENVQVDGPSAKVVDGTSDLKVMGAIRVSADGSIYVSSKGNINVTALGDINFQCNGTFNVCAKGGISMKTNGEFAANSTATMSLLTDADLHLKTNGGCFFGGQGSISMKGAGDVNIDGSTVNINGGASGDASPTKIPDFNIPTANPTVPNVPKI